MTEPLRILIAALLTLVVPMLAACAGSDPGNLVDARITTCEYVQQGLGAQGHTRISIEVEVSAPVRRVVIDVGTVIPGVADESRTFVGTATFENLEPGDIYTRDVQAPSSIPTATDCYLTVTNVEA